MSKDTAVELRYKSTEPLTMPLDPEPRARAKKDPEPRARAKKDLLVYLGFLLLVEGAGAIIGISSASQISTWWVNVIT